MECEKVRDRFSLLQEGELPPGEEKEVREHLSSCPECQRDFQKFEKTVHWLQSVEEVDVPEGFLSEVREKLEERSQRGGLSKEARRRPLSYLSKVKLPMQAVAMVAVLFLVLYVTKMIPLEVSHQKTVPSPKSSLSEEKKAAPVQPPSEKAYSTVLEKPSAPAPREEGADKAIPLKQAPPALKSEASQPVDLLKSAEQLPPEAKGDWEPRAKDRLIKEPETSLPEKKAEKTIFSRRELKRVERAGAVSADVPRSYPAAESGKQLVMQQERARLPSKDILLKISDRDRFLARLYGLVRDLGGNIVQTQENVLLASVPPGSFARFEKDLGGLPGIKEAPAPGQPALGVLSSASKVNEREGKDEEKEVAPIDSDREDRIAIRIRLVQE